MPLRDVRHQAAIVRDHNILLLRVDDHDQATSYWLLPGGGSEDGESGEDCVCREVREEAGVDVTVSRTLFEHILEPNHLYERVRTYLCTVAPDAVPLPGDEPEVYWSTTIVETGWFDLRSTGGWPPELLGTNVRCSGWSGYGRRWGIAKALALPTARALVASGDASPETRGRLDLPASQDPRGIE